MRSNRIRSSLQLLTLAFLSCLFLVAAGATAAEEPGYGFYRTVEGDVRLTTLERAEPLDVEPNYPLLLGDRIWVAAGGRLEAVLPDQTVLRAGGGTDLYFEDLALYAAESASAGTVLRLLEGEVLVVVADYGDEFQPLRIETPNATIYLQEPGTYRIYADERRWTEVVVREGFSEVVLAEGSVVLRAHEEAVIDGSEDPRVRVYPAGAIDDLEAWAAELDREAEVAATEVHVDEELAYQAAPLARHGEWLPLRAGYVWRPRVPPGWRPYSHGYWTHTPAGLYWVSGYPWGAHTFHYGSWDLHIDYGWVWHPGRVFSPAWVYWYWGPTHVGWVPSGYYTHYYGRHRHHYGPRYPYHYGFHFGTYGYASGYWHHYAHWTFSPVRYFGWRSYRHHWRSGSELHRHNRGRAVPRGVIARDTSSLDRHVWTRPDQAVEVLLRQPVRPGQASQRLPDVTRFVAREPTLGSDVREAIFARPGEIERTPWVAGAPRLRSEVGAPRGDVGGHVADRTPLERNLRSPGDRERAEVVRGLPAEPVGTPGIAASVDRPISVGRPAKRQPATLPSAGVRPSATRPIPENPRARSVAPGVNTRRPLVTAPSASNELPGSPRPSSRLSGFSTRQPTATRRLGERASPAPLQAPSRRSPSTNLGRELPASPAGAPSIEQRVRWSSPPSQRKVPVVQRVLDSIRGSGPTTSRPPSAGYVAPTPRGGSTLRSTPGVSSPRLSAPSVARPSRPTATAPRVSPPVKPNSSNVSRPSPSGSTGRSSVSSSSRSGRPASSSRSQSRTKTKPPG
jgi:hypothetical protein